MKRKRKFSEYIVIALIFFAVWFYRDSLQEIWWGIRQITAKELLCCVALAAVYFLLDGTLVLLAARAFIKQMKGYSGIFITYVCEFYRLITLGSGTFVAEIYYLCKKGLTPAQGTAGSAYKYALKKSSILLTGLAGFAWLYAGPNTHAMMQEYVAFAWIATGLCCLIIAGFLLVSLSQKIADLVIRWIKKLSQKIKWVSAHADGWITQIESLSKEGSILWKDWRRAGLMLVINMIKCIVIYAVIAILLRQKSVLHPIDLMAIMAVVYFLAGVLPVPSGVMSLEYVFGLFMGNFFDIGIYVPAILTFRFFTWIFPAGIGGVLQMIWHIKNKEKPTIV